MKIPKIIHYCWFGGKPMPHSVKRCIESWKKHCPDFQLMLWDESCIDIEENSFINQAYQAGKWAFVSDYARLKALSNYGGIYLDTDVEMLRSPERYMDNEMFLGFESNTAISTAVIGCIKGHYLIYQLAEEYSSKEFDMTPNVVFFTKALSKLGLKANGTEQSIGGIKVYSSDVFSPKNLETGKIMITENTCAIHHFDASWLSAKNKINRRLAQIIGPELTNKLKRIMGKSKNE